MMASSMFLWGLANPFSDIAMDDLTPAETYGIEVGTGTAVFLAIVLFTPSLRRRAHRINWAVAAPLGLIMPGLCFYWGNIGYEYSSVTTGVILLSTEAIFTAVLGTLWLGEHLSLKAVLAILMGIVGVIMVGIAGQSHATEAIGRTYGVLGVQFPAAAVGAWAFVLSALFSGIFAIGMRRYAAHNDIIGLTVGQLITALVFGVAIWLAKGVSLSDAYQYRTSFHAAMMAGILGSAFAFLMFNWASEHVPARQIALTLNTIPVVAIALGALLGRGLPTPLQVVGAVIVLASLVFLENAEHPADEAVTAA